MAKKNFIKDIILNVIAVMLPIAVLQLVSLPYIGSELGAEAYGEVVFLISIFTLIAFPFGNVLNNVRLLTNDKYEERRVNGDFNFLLLCSIVIGIMVFFIYSNKNTFINYIDVILILIIIILTITKEYFIVSFRLILNFKKIVLNNVYLAIGYLIGTLIFTFINYWEIVYITGLILSNLYIYKKSSLVNEGFKRTLLFKDTLKDSLYLYSAGLIKNSITHADKLLLFPLLGPTNVAVYYSSSIIGKMMSMLVNPAQTVILSYLVKMNQKVKITYYFTIVTILGLMFYLLILLIGPIFLKVLYSSWYRESILLLKYTAATSVVSVLASLLHPFNMRYNDLKWQLYINGSFFIVYLLLSVILTKQYGITGFAIGVLIATVYNLIIQVVIYYLNNNKSK